MSLEEHLFGQQAEILHRYPDALIAATDGSVLEDGRMGASVTFLQGECPEIRQGVQGDPCSTTAEMHALLLAVTQELPPSPSQNEVPIRPLIGDKEREVIRERGREEEERKVVR
jgi:hypothetical protein